jgi:hypothetical protein
MMNRCESIPENVPLSIRDILEFESNQFDLKEVHDEKHRLQITETKL